MNDDSCLYFDAIGDCGGICDSDIDMDSICDNVDECIGAVDECDVCNGPGAIYDCGCSNIQKVIATAMATKLTPSACAVARVILTKMAMEFAMTLKSLVALWNSRAIIPPMQPWMMAVAFLFVLDVPILMPAILM